MRVHDAGLRTARPAVVMLAVLLTGCSTVGDPIRIAPMAALGDETVEAAALEDAVAPLGLRCRPSSGEVLWCAPGDLGSSVGTLVTVGLARDENALRVTIVADGASRSRVCAAQRAIVGRLRQRLGADRVIVGPPQRCGSE